MDYTSFHFCVAFTLHAVAVEFESSEYNVQESAELLEICLVLNGTTQFPVSFRVTSGESNPVEAEGEECEFES